MSDKIDDMREVLTKHIEKIEVEVNVVKCDLIVTNETIEVL